MKVRVVKVRVVKVRVVKVRVVRVRVVKVRVVRVRVELAFRPASKPFISCSESASADGTQSAGQVFSNLFSCALQVDPYLRFNS